MLEEIREKLGRKICSPGIITALIVDQFGRYVAIATMFDETVAYLSEDGETFFQIGTDADFPLIIQLEKSE